MPQMRAFQLYKLFADRRLVQHHELSQPYMHRLMDVIHQRKKDATVESFSRVCNAKIGSS